MASDWFEPEGRLNIKIPSYQYRNPNVKKDKTRESPYMERHSFILRRVPGSRWQTPGGWFNIKMSYQYRKSHCGDNTVVRSFYRHNRISLTGKMTYSYWIRSLAQLWRHLQNCDLFRSLLIIKIWVMSSWSICKMVLRAFNSLVLGTSGCDFKNAIFNIVFFCLVSSDLLMIVPSHECHGTLLMISQHWFR